MATCVQQEDTVVGFSRLTLKPSPGCRQAGEDSHALLSTTDSLRQAAPPPLGAPGPPPP